MPSRLGAKSSTTDCFAIGKETAALRRLALSACTRHLPKGRFRSP